MSYTVQKKIRNELSRNEAANFAEPWAAYEVEELEGFWGDVPLDEIALALGRTIEACRQKHYELRNGVVRTDTATVKAAKAVRTTNEWSKGFTSLADMDAYYESLGG